MSRPISGSSGQQHSRAVQSKGSGVTNFDLDFLVTLLCASISQFTKWED